jgi:hypothetical protein
MKSFKLTNPSGCGSILSAYDAKREFSKAGRDIVPAIDLAPPIDMLEVRLKTSSAVMQLPDAESAVPGIASFSLLWFPMSRFL